MPAREPFTPRNNLHLYRLRGFVGRTADLGRARDWLAAEHRQPLLLVGGPGIGKSTLATVAAWGERGRFPGGIVWVGASGHEPFRLEDIYFQLDAVLDSSVLVKPLAARAAAALDLLDAEPRLLVLDEIETLEAGMGDAVLALARRVGEGGRSRVVVIADELPADWRRELPGLVMAPSPLDADDVAAMAATDVVPVAAATLAPSTAGDLAKWARGNPLSCRLGLGLADAVHGADGLAEALSNLDGAPVSEWIAMAEGELRRVDPVAAQLLSRLSLASGGAGTEAVTDHYWRGLGPAEELDAAVTTLSRRGLLIRGRTRLLMHPSVREHLSRAPAPASDERCLEALEADLMQYYLGEAGGYSRRPQEHWAEIDPEWPNIRHFANRAVDRLEAHVGRPLEDVATVDELPTDVTHCLRTVEDYALSLLYLILWRHPRSGRHWLAAAGNAARILGHPHRAAQLRAALGALYYVEDEPESAVQHFSAAREAFDELGDLRRMMQTQLELGAVFRALDRHDEAIATYADAAQLAESAGDDIDRAAVYAQLGAAYLSAGTPFQAIDYLMKARGPLEREGGPALAALLNNLGLAYEAVGRFRDAIGVYMRSFDLIEPSTKSTQHQMSTIAGNIGAAHYELGDMEEALNWYRRDLALSQAIGDQADTAAVHHNLGHVLLEMGVAQAAIAEFAKAAEIYQRLGFSALVAEEESAIAHAHVLMARDPRGTGR